MQHQRRRRFGFLPTRHCTCGERWPCPDAAEWPVGVPIPDGSPERPTPHNRAAGARRHAWNSQTVALPQAGPAGRLTPAQAYRANGGRW